MATIYEFNTNTGYHSLKKKKLVYSNSHHLSRALDPVGNASISQIETETKRSANTDCCCLWPAVAPTATGSRLLFIGGMKHLKVSRSLSTLYPSNSFPAIFLGESMYFLLSSVCLSLLFSHCSAWSQGRTTGNKDSLGLP